MKWVVTCVQVGVVATDEFLTYPLSTDKICDVTNYSITGAPISEAVLGCHDRVIRVVQDSNVLLEIVVEGPANSVTNYNYQAKETPR